MFSDIDKSYITPLLEIVDLEVESICTTSNLENPKDGNDYEW